MERFAIARLVVAIFAGMLSCPAQAQTVTTYTSLQDWQTAVNGSSQFSTNFQGFTQDTYFQTASVNVGPFSLQQIGQDPVFGLFQNFIDVPPLQFTDNSGVTNVAMYTKFGVQTVNMTFASPIFAWGANFYNAQSNELVNLILTSTGSGVVATVPVTVDTGFFGFVVSPIEGLSEITFQSQIENPLPSVGQGFGLENVVGAYSSSSLPVLTKGDACNGTFGGTFNGNVSISSVQSCTFVSGNITGHVQLKGGNLVLTGTTVGGYVQADGGGTFAINSGTHINGYLLIEDIPSGSAQNQVCGSTVNGNAFFLHGGTSVTIGAATPGSCAGNVIGGNLAIQGNTAPVSAVGNTVGNNLTAEANTAATTLDGNTVAGNLRDWKNTAPTQVFNNIITLDLQCAEDSSITGGGNTAQQKRGQCASF